MVTKKEKLLIVDGHAMVFRAWFSIPERLNSNKIDTRGAYGFINTLIKSIRENNITHIVVCFDTKAATFRDEIFPEYKAQRPPVDPNLHKQIPIAKDLLSSLQIPVFEKDGFEADDLVGTISSIANSKELDCLILTGDADQLQLVNKETNVLMYSGFGDIRIYDTEKVKERYDGLGPEFVAEIKALEGDPSDNIPGVPGIGKKAARTLLSEYGHFENLFENINNIENIELRGAKRIQNILSENIEVAKKGLSLTEIVTNVEIDFEIKKCEFTNHDSDKIKSTFEHYELRNSFNNIKSIINLTNEIPEKKITISTIDIPEDSLILVNNSEVFEKMLIELKASNHFSFDTETTGLNTLEDEIIGISFSNSENKAWYLVIKHDEINVSFNKENFEKIKNLFEDPSISKSAHNANFDMMVLKNFGIEVENLDFDTVIAAALCGRRNLGLKNLSTEILNISMTRIQDLIGTGKNQKTLDQININEVYKYAASDSLITFKLRNYFINELKKFNQEDLFYKVEIPLIKEIITMQYNGFLLDLDKLNKMSKALEIDLDELDQTIHNIYPEKDFNLNSGKQVAEILVDHLNAPTIKKTKTGISVDAEVLENYSQNKNLDERIVQIASGILRYRELSKIKSTYVDSLPNLINKKTQRIHTTFNQLGTSTGRLSSQNPNVQNIPVRSDIGRQVRSAFIVDQKKKFQMLSVDYSQIELRVLAHLSKEENLVKAFINGEDIHNSTAELMYGSSQVSQEQRRIAKILNFGVLYGLGPHGVSQQTDLTRQQGKEFIDLYFGKYPGIKEFQNKLIQDAKSTGYSETLLGRRRYIDDINSANGRARSFAERVAINMPIQGTAAEIIKVAMINLGKEIKINSLNSKMLIQVHDELIFEVAPGELMELSMMINEIMPNAIKLDVPVLVDIKTGDSWGKLE
ncbi:MAG: DNA polymerase I [Dehalococcoidales bacterium]|nr:DNA polymerase I [Dehalococcoidales bacterium]